MKKLFFVLVCLFIISGCATTVKEVGREDYRAGDSDWDPADLIRVQEQMVNSVKNHPFFSPLIQSGEPIVMLIVKKLQNKTDEHIDTRLILEKVRTGMIKQGVAQFVDDQAFDTALEQLNLQASDLYDNSKAARIGKFVGAKYILRGSIANIRKKSGRKDVNYMNVMLDIFEVETLLIKWTDEYDMQRITKKSIFR